MGPPHPRRVNTLQGPCRSFVLVRADSMAELPNWNAGDTRDAIVDFVRRSTGGDGGEPVSPAERVAVYDNDGTLWCEKPMPIQLDFILRRLAEMAAAEPELRERQPWKAAYERDYGWLGRVVAEHYAGDDTNVRIRRCRRACGLCRHQRRRLHGPVGSLPAQRSSSHPRPRLPRVRVRARWSSCFGIWRRTASPTTSPPAVDATSCDRSRRTCTESRASGSSAAAPPSNTSPTSRRDDQAHSRGRLSR